jgi:hypothetical protein
VFEPVAVFWGVGCKLCINPPGESRTRPSCYVSGHTL